MGGDVIRDWEDEEFVDAGVGTVSSLGEDLVSLGVFHGFVAVALVKIVGGVVGVDLVGTVVLVTGLAELALHAGLYLCTDSDTIPDLDAGLAVFAYLEDSADDFVANT